jgi:hypothetical protein
MTSGNGHPQRANRGRSRRSWLFVTLLFVLLVAIVAGALWHWRLALAERVMPGAVRSAGVELVAVSVDRLDFTGAELSGLRFGPLGSQHIASVKLTWLVSELLDRRLSAIEISGADLQVFVGPDGKPALEGLLPSGNTGRTTGGLAFPTDLPFKRVDVRQSRVVVTLPDGKVDVTVEGQLEASPGALTGDVSARYAAETQRGGGTGTGSASVAWAQDSAPRGEIALEFDRLVTANATGTNIRLSGSTDGVPAQLEDISFRAVAFAESIETSEISAHDVDLTAELSGGTFEVGIDGKVLDWAVEASARLQPFDLSVPAAVYLSARGDMASVSERLADLSAEGDVAIEIDTEINNPAGLFAARDAITQDPLVLADHVAGRLNLEANLQQFGLSNWLRGGVIDAKVAAHWNDGILDVDIGEGAHAEGVKLKPGLERKLTAWLPRVSPFDVALTGGMGSPPTVRLDFNGGPDNVHAVGGVDLALPGGTIEVEVDGGATISISRGVEGFDVAALKAVLNSVPTTFGSVTGDVLVTDLSSEDKNISAVVGGELSVSALSASPVSARRLTMNMDGEFRSTTDEIRVVLSPGGKVTARDLRLKGGKSLPGTTRLQLAGGTQRLALNRRNGGVSLDVRLRPGEAKVHAGARDLGMTYGPLTVSGAWPGRLDIAAEDVSTVLDTQRGINLADVRVRADGKTSDAVVAITATGAAPVLPGLTLPSFDATAKIVRRGPALDGELEIIASGGQPNLRAHGQHNLKTGKGEGEILEALLRFAPGVLQPDDINPAMAGTFESVFATISLQGPLAWERADTLRPNLTLVIDDLAVATGNLELFDASATVLLTGASAFETPPEQKFTGKVRVGRLDPVPLDVSFQLLPGQSGSGPALVIESLTAQLAEGRLTTDRFKLTPPSIDTDVKLRIEGADLARAFEVIGVAGIGGTGRISGEIPILVRGNQVAISNGRMANDGPGEVFYDIAALPLPLIDRDDTVTLVLKALSNFAYDELQVEMDKALDGPGSLHLRLTGANPDVLESHPFIFNINLESNFDRLAALVLEGLTTSQGLLRALALSAGNSTNTDVPP